MSLSLQAKPSTKYGLTVNACTAKSLKKYKMHHCMDQIIYKIQAEEERTAKCIIVSVTILYTIQADNDYSPSKVSEEDRTKRDPLLVSVLS